MGSQATKTDYFLLTVSLDMTLEKTYKVSNITE